MEKDHKIISDVSNSRHQTRREQPFSILLREPDVYHDPKEVIWKSIAINTYYEINQILSDSGVLSDPEIKKLQIKIIDAFNSNHSHDIFYEKVEAPLKALNMRLDTLGKSELYGTIEKEISASKVHIRETLDTFKRGYISYPVEEQTHIVDGIIEIAGMPIEKFSLQKIIFLRPLNFS